MDAQEHELMMREVYAEHVAERERARYTEMLCRFRGDNIAEERYKVRYHLYSRMAARIRKICAAHGFDPSPDEES